MTTPIVILAGGGSATPRIPLPAARVVIAADSGLHLAEPLGLAVDVIVGDLDSADEDAVRRAVTTGARVERHPTDKDATDLDLALASAVEHGGGRTIVVGGVDGDRLDHLLAAASLLGSDRYPDLEIEWWDGASIAYPTRGRREIAGESGDLLSIIPIGPATVSVAGVRWPLEDQPLEHGSTRAVSNELTATRATVSVSSGTAFVVHTRRNP